MTGLDDFRDVAGREARRPGRPGALGPLPAAVLVAGLGLTAVTWWAGERARRAEAEAHFGAAATARAHELERELESCRNALAGLQRFYESSELVEADEFATFAGPLVGEVSAIRSIRFLPDPADARARSAGTHVVPAEPERRGALGTLRGEAWFSTAVRELRGSAGIVVARPPAATGPLLLVASVDGDEAGVPSAARSRHQGFLVAELDLPAGLEKAAEARRAAGPAPPISLAIEESIGSRSVLAARSEQAARPSGGTALRTERELDFASAGWRLVATSPRRLWLPDAGWREAGLPAAVLALTAAVTALLAAGARRRVLSEELAQRRAELLRASSHDLKREAADRASAEAARDDGERRSRAILGTTTDGVITVDARGNVVELNPAGEAMFGWDSEEIASRPFTELLTEEDGLDYARRLREYVAGGAPTLLGDAREVTGRRRDGSTLPLELTVTDFTMGDRHYLAGVARDISERKRIERMQDEFISTVSHELRTPLTSIVGGLRLLEGGTEAELSSEQASLVRIALANGSRLVHLLNDLLDLEKMRSGTLSVDRRPISVAEVVREAVGEMEGFASQRRVRLLVSEDLPEAVVMADRARLGQVLLNLLSNAVKYSPEGGEVRITGGVEGGRGRVSVHDRGPGIPEADRERVFQRFSRLDASDSREVGGTGLGLAIARELVERHGGRLWVEAEPGGGSCFTFEVPVRVPSERPPSRPGSSRILIVEDDPDVGHLLQRLLAEGGFESEVAATAEEALARIEEGGVAALTVDVGLPGASGIELVRMLRARPECRSLPVVFVSAEGEERLGELNGQAVGVLDWLTKPIDADRLLAALEGARGEGSANPRILHVEDDLDTVELVRRTLGDRAEVVSAVTVAEAREALAREPVDLVLLDLGLPDGHGAELLGDLPRGPNRDTPVVLFTASEPTAEVAQAVALTLIKTRTSGRELAGRVADLLRRRVPGGQAAGTEVI